MVAVMGGGGYYEFERKGFFEKKFLQFATVFNYHNCDLIF